MKHVAKVLVRNPVEGVTLSELPVELHVEAEGQREEDYDVLYECGCHKPRWGLAGPVRSLYIHGTATLEKVLIHKSGTSASGTKRTRAWLFTQHNVILVSSSRTFSGDYIDEFQVAGLNKGVLFGHGMLKTCFSPIEEHLRRVRDEFIVACKAAGFDYE